MAYPQKPDATDRPGREEMSIADFPGLVSNMDPRRLPTGAAIHQVNLVSSHPAELRVRGGCRLVSFDV